MKNLWPVLRGILIALVSLGILIGGLSLSMAEGNMVSKPSPSPTSTPAPTSSPTWLPFTTTRADTPTSASPTWTPSLILTPTNCPPPTGWLAYIIKPGDTLESLAAHFQINTDELQQANCLPTTVLLPGVIIYVPSVPLIPTQTRIPCGPPLGWITYIVQPSDTLYHLSQSFGIAVPELQRANCFGSSTLLHVGQMIYVPPWATRTPSPTFPGISTPTYIPSDTPILTPETPTDTSPEVSTDTPTEVWTDTPTESPIPDTPTEIPTDMLELTATY